MRFRFKENKPGDARRKKVFLIFPKQLDGEYRWLCFSEIFQIYSAGGSSTGYDYTSAGWKDVGWGDKIKGIKIGKPKMNLFSASSYTEFEIEYTENNKDSIEKRLEAIGR